MLRKHLSFASNSPLTWQELQKQHPCVFHARQNTMTEIEDMLDGLLGQQPEPPPSEWVKKSPSKKRAVTAAFWKTKLCKHHNESRCFRTAQQCRFAHGEHDLVKSATQANHSTSTIRYSTIQSRSDQPNSPSPTAIVLPGNHQRESITRDASHSQTAATEASLKRVNSNGQLSSRERTDNTVAPESNKHYGSFGMESLGGDTTASLHTPPKPHKHNDTSTKNSDADRAEDTGSNTYVRHDDGKSSLKDEAVSTGAKAESSHNGSSDCMTTRSQRSSTSTSGDAVIFSTLPSIPTFETARGWHQVF